MESPSNIGSRTAKAGFREERLVSQMISNCDIDPLGMELACRMGVFNDGFRLHGCEVVSGSKSDIVITKERGGEIERVGVQVKLVSNRRGFNQIDKRWVSSYADAWGMPSSVAGSLMKFTGESRPTEGTTRDNRRYFADELGGEEVSELVNFFNENSCKISSTIFTDKSGPHWYVIADRSMGDVVYNVYDVGEVISFYFGDMNPTKRGSFRLGRVTMQRKGGDSGRRTANKLQFKIDPADILRFS